MLLEIGKKIPFLQSLLFFSRKSHGIALGKFCTLWVLASSPVLLAIMLSPVPDDGDLWLGLYGKLEDAISSSELFIYTSAFLSPLLFIIFERYKSIESDSRFDQKVSESFKLIFKGYLFVSLVAAFILFMTMSAYAATKTNIELFQATYLHQLLSGSALFLYLYALYCWYLSILDGVAVPGDFVEVNREAEETLTGRFSSRIRGRRE